MQFINYRSSIDFIMRLSDADGDTIGWPTFNWIAKFWTSANGPAMTASVIDGVATNCYEDEGLIHVILDNHSLPPGQLHVTFDALLEDSDYADGDRRVAIPLPLDIKLIREAAPCPKAFDIQLQLPAIKIKYSELTEEEKAELMAPAIEAAGRVDDALSGVAAATEAAGEAADAANRAAGKAEGAAEAARTAADAAQVAAGAAEGAADAANRATGNANTATDEAIAAAAKANEAAEGLIRDVGKVEEAIDKADAARDAAIKAAGTAEEKAGLAEAAATKATEAATEANSINEAIVEAEGRRVVAEKAREVAEDLRESAEGLRAEAEVKRAKAESQRVAAEVSRDTEEAKRAKAETLREEEEVSRDEAESEREAAEQSRVDAEARRVTEESKRAKAETLREEAEVSRDEAESEREAAEQQRVAAEAERAETFAGFEGEIADAKYALFIDTWNSVWGKYGGYDAEATDGHPYLGNGLHLSYAEAIEIISRYNAPPSVELGQRYTDVRVKTVPPIKLHGYADRQNYSWAFAYASGLLAVRFDTIASVGSAKNMFYACGNLQHIYGHLDLGYAENTHAMFTKCAALQTVNISKLKASISLGDSGLLSLESLRFLVSNSANASVITVTVHPDVYAKLTDETNAEWHQILIDATAKNISFATI